MENYPSEVLSAVSEGINKLEQTWNTKHFANVENCFKKHSDSMAKYEECITPHQKKFDELNEYASNFNIYLQLRLGNCLRSQSAKE